VPHQSHQNDPVAAPHQGVPGQMLAVAVNSGNNKIIHQDILTAFADKTSLWPATSSGLAPPFERSIISQCKGLRGSCTFKSSEPEGVLSECSVDLPCFGVERRAAP